MTFELSDATIVEYDDEEFEIDRVYFKAGLRNAPLRVWSGDGAEVHYRPQTGESAVIDIETGETTFVEPVETDGETVALEETR